MSNRVLYEIKYKAKSKKDKALKTTVLYADSAEDLKSCFFEIYGSSFWIHDFYEVEYE